jgi:hypothetical protein
MRPGHAADARDLDGLAAVHRRQDRREAPGQHRLPGSGWAGQEQVVAAGGGDDQRVDGGVLPADVAEVGQRGIVGDLRGCACRRGLGGHAVQHGRRLGQRRHPEDLHLVNQGSLADARGPDDQAREAAAPGALRDGKGPAACPHLATERQLAEDGMGRQALDGHLLARGQDTQGDRQVEARPGISQVRRREVDRHPARGEREALVLQGRAHPLARLADRAVAETDDGERG